MASAKSDFLPGLARTSATLPEGYPARFTMYQTVNRADINQVRYLYANAVALQAAREGRPLPDGSVLVLEQHATKLGDDKKPIVGADGYFVKERLLAYAIMGRDAGWNLSRWRPPACVRHWPQPSAAVRAGRLSFLECPNL